MSENSIVFFQVFVSLGFYGGIGPQVNETYENAGYGAGGISWLTHTSLNRTNFIEPNQRNSGQMMNNYQGSNFQSNNRNAMPRSFNYTNNINPQFAKNTNYNPYLQPQINDPMSSYGNIGVLRPTVNNAFVLQSRLMSRGIINVIDDILWPPERRDQTQYKTAYYALEDPQFSRLRQLAERSDYFRAELRSMHHQTWFLPNDQAFTSMGSSLSFLLDQTSMNNTNDINEFVGSHVVPLVIFADAMDSTKRVITSNGAKWITFRKISHQDHTFQVDVISGRYVARILISRPEEIRFYGNGIVYPISTILYAPTRSAADELFRNHQYFMTLVQQSGDLELLNILQGSSMPNMFNPQLSFNITVLIPQQMSIQQLGTGQELSMNLRRHILRLPVYTDQSFLAQRTTYQKPSQSTSNSQQNFYQPNRQQPLNPQQNVFQNNQQQQPINPQQNLYQPNQQQLQQQQQQQQQSINPQQNFYQPNQQQQQQQQPVNSQQNFYQPNQQQQQQPVNSQQNFYQPNRQQQSPLNPQQQMNPQQNFYQTGQQQQNMYPAGQRAPFMQQNINQQQQQFQRTGTGADQKQTRRRRQINIPTTTNFQTQQFPRQQSLPNQQMFFNQQQQLPNQPMVPTQQQIPLQNQPMMPIQQQQQQLPNQPMLPTQQQIPLLNQPMLPTQQQIPLQNQPILPAQQQLFNPMGSFLPSAVFQNGQIYPTLDPQFNVQAQISSGPNGNIVALIGQSTNSLSFSATILNSESNIEIKNGVMHVIRGLLSGTILPIEGVLPLVQGASAFAQLLHQTGVINQLRQSNRPYTLFVPTNAALQSIGVSNDMNRLRHFVLRHICADILLDPTNNILRRSAGFYKDGFKMRQQAPRQKRQTWPTNQQNLSNVANRQGFPSSNLGPGYFPNQQQVYGTYPVAPTPYGMNNQLYDGNVNFNNIGVPNNTMNIQFNQGQNFGSYLSGGTYTRGPQSCMALTGERITVQSLAGTQPEGNTPSMSYQNYMVTCCGDQSVNSLVQSFNIYPPNFAVYLIGRALLSQGQTLNTMYNSTCQWHSSFLMIIFFILLTIFKQIQQF